jgi:hypothetical protein
MDVAATEASELIYRGPVVLFRQSGHENPPFDKLRQLPDDEKAKWMGCEAGAAIQAALRDSLRFGSPFYGACPLWLTCDAVSTYMSVIYDS